MEQMKTMDTMERILMPTKLESPLRPQEAADYIGIDISTLYKMIKRGDIEGFYVGEEKHGIRIEQAEIRRYKRKYSTKRYGLN